MTQPFPNVELPEPTFSDAESPRHTPVPAPSVVKKAQHAKRAYTAAATLAAAWQEAGEGGERVPAELVPGLEARAGEIARFRANVSGARLNAALQTLRPYQHPNRHPAVLLARLRKVWWAVLGALLLVVLLLILLIGSRRAQTALSPLPATDVPLSTLVASPIAESTP